jgi:hypothetical protein
MEFSAESAPGATVEDLATWIRHNKVAQLSAR